LSNGAIEGVVFSGTDLTSVSWFDAWDNIVATGNDLNNVPAGSYFAEVTFGSGCTQRFGPYLIADENAPAAMVDHEDDHCDRNIGSITITPETGNVTDYQYSLNGVDYFPLTGEITGLPADTYYVTIKDQSGCISNVVTVELTNVGPPTINCFSTPASGTSSNGTITVLSSNYNLTYQLEGGLPQTGNTFTNLAAAEYYVIVTDAFGCVTRDTIVVDLHQGTFLAALAKDDRKCLYKPANSDIRITAVNKLTDIKATLYFNNNILKCTNFNANEVTFPGITAQLFTTPARIELSWHGIDPVTSTDTLLIGTMIFETIQYGIANVEWDTLSSVTYFLNQYGESIFPYFQPGIINVHELPEIDIDREQQICEKGSITLIPQVTGGAEPVEYTWITPDGTTVGTATTDGAKEYLKPTIPAKGGMGRMPVRGYIPG
jgi:putative component of membrane protein insertase Oxa1/YidC/SpoIIIJ protein YidD